MEISQVSTDITRIRLQESVDDSHETMRSLRSFVQILMRGVAGANTAILLGSIFVEYIEDEIETRFGWHEGVHYTMAQGLNCWSELQFWSGKSAMFFRRAPENWSHLNLEQAQTCAAIVYFVNYTGPNSIDALVSRDLSDEANLALILSCCDIILRPSDDGFGVELLVMTELLTSWGLDSSLEPDLYISPSDVSN